MAAVYNFNDVIQGTTLEARVFALKRYVNEELVDLTSCIVRFQVFRSSTSKFYINEDSQTGIVTINDAGLCLVEVGEIKEIELTPAKYYWHLLVEYPDGDKKIFIGGKFNVVTIKEFSDV
jgi:hypothetical protein